MKQKPSSLNCSYENTVQVHASMNNWHGKDLIVGSQRIVGRKSFLKPKRSAITYNHIRQMFTNSTFEIFYQNVSLKVLKRNTMLHGVVLMTTFCWYQDCYDYDKGIFEMQPVDSSLLPWYEDNGTTCHSRTSDDCQDWITNLLGHHSAAYNHIQ